MSKSRAPGYTAYKCEQAENVADYEASHPSDDPYKDLSYATKIRLIEEQLRFYLFKPTPPPPKSMPEYTPIVDWTRPSKRRSA